MNLVYTRQVLAAHKAAVIFGIVLSSLAALFVYAQPTWDGGPTMETRTPQVWHTSDELFLTQKGFPQGRVNFSLSSGDQSRFSTLAVLYAQLATSDRVLGLAGISEKLGGNISAEPVVYEVGRFATPVVLPMVRISATARTAGEASDLARRASQALQRYVTSGQSGAKIQARARVILQPSRSGDVPVLVSGPSKALPVVIFALLVGLVLMAVFAYHNYRAGIDDLSDAVRPVNEVGRDSKPIPTAERPARRQPSIGLGRDASRSHGLKARHTNIGAVLSAEPSTPVDTDVTEMPTVRHRPAQG